ncbi:carboxymuconolactone decarboxylase family protein [Variovorax sp. LjRoot290]|uniref:carboxymuconolactone decarboxylase family protein n=1 Tax=unclassified Variovorax TaxID=663243 RepID=UPI0008860CE7|nr:carboxymuconolactone decarboxylase family protein [Variovorax sp. CF079]SDC31922.1 alkylhydroperoxidase AhpD family core domain-containing protein [Variovorax sp. CF079]
MAHTARLPYHQLAPKAFQGLLDASAAVHKGALGSRLVDLVLLRLSQINGCGYCIDMHWRDLIRQEIDPRHLNALAGWREAPFFSERERAALRWAELVNATPHSDASDEEFARLKAHFTDVEIVELGFTIAVINAWNLLNVSFRNPVPEKV